MHVCVRVYASHSLRSLG